MFVKLMARQLRRPSGLLGRYVARWMNRSNVALYRAALDLTQTARGGPLLEIGFGGGALLEMALSSGRFSKVCGIDASPEMVRGARRRLSAHIQRELLDLRHGDIADLPYAAAVFDAVVSLNTIYFWPTLDTGLSACRRVLSAGGLLVLGFDDKAQMRQWPGHRHGFKLYEVEAVCAALAAGGFEAIDWVSGSTQEWGRFHCVHARRKPSSD